MMYIIDFIGIFIRDGMFEKTAVATCEMATAWAITGERRRVPASPASETAGSVSR